MNKNYVFHPKRAITLFGLLWLLCTHISAIDKTINTYVGDTFTFSPWSDASSSYSGYTCASTGYKSEDATAFSINESSRTKTQYPSYEATGWVDGFYCSYRAKALKTGTFIIYGYVTCHKREGYMPTNHYVGSPVITYHVIVSEKPKVVSITIPSNLSLTTGDSYTFSPVIYEEGANTTLSWTSSNTSVASINNGTLKALSPGNTTITCTAANGVSAQCFVTVNPIYVSSISLNKSEIDIDEGDKFTLVATILPTNATNKEIEWISSNENVAFVGTTGIVVGISSGYCNITAKSTDGSNKSVSCLVYVKKKSIFVESIAITPVSATLKVGETTALTATISPYNATDGSLSWSSSDVSVATVDANGNVTAISTGDATITASANDGSGVTGTCRINVSPILVESIAITPASATLKVGETTALTAIISPYNATDGSLSWSSSDADVATVDVNGNVTAISTGDATITASANDGSGVTGTCRINVSPILVESIAITPAFATLKVGETTALTATVLPYNATDGSLTWTSSDISIATVNREGLVSAISAGMTTIVATANDGSAIFASCLLTVVNKEEESMFKYEYNFDAKKATLISANEKYSGDIIIPSKVIHEGVEYTVTAIGDYCFYNCEELKSVVIPSTVTDIGKDCFAYSYSLSSVTIGNSVENIGAWAFATCSSLSSITLPNSIKEIGEYAFYDCPLITIALPNSVTSIKNNTFAHCSNLEYIYIPHSVTSIGDYAFGGCSKLAALNIPNSITSIGGSAFQSCSSLTSIVIPESITKIEECTFWHCSSLTSITLPETITVIGGGAFAWCSSLKSVFIPESVTDFGWGATFEDCTNLESVNIPKSVTKIVRGMFMGCSNLSSIHLPKAITDIEAWAFKDCANLKSVTCEAETPPSVSAYYGDGDLATYVGSESVFSDDTYSTATLFVPNECVDLYKSADVWSLFRRIESIENISGINSSLIDGNALEKAIYDVTGKNHQGLKRGINIIRYSDGTTRKVFVK